MPAVTANCSIPNSSTGQQQPKFGWSAAGVQLVDSVGRRDHNATTAPFPAAAARRNSCSISSSSSSTASNKTPTVTCRRRAGDRARPCHHRPSRPVALFPAIRAVNKDKPRVLLLCRQRAGDRARAACCVHLTAAARLRLTNIGKTGELPFLLFKKKPEKRGIIE